MELSEMEDFKKMINDKLELNCKSIISNLESSMTLQNERLKDFIGTKIKESEQILTNAFNNLLSERDRKIESLEIRLAEVQQQHEESKLIERKKCNLVVNGIPYDKEENIVSVYQSISSQLGYALPPAANVYRMPGENAAKRPIIIRLESDLQVDQFMSRYYKVAKSLKLGTLEGFSGSGSQTRIYISEDLSTNQYNIFKQAMIFLKSNVILNIRKKSGSVLIKINDQTRHRSYNSVDELKADVSSFNSTN